MISSLTVSGKDGIDGHELSGNTPPSIAALSNTPIVPWNEYEDVVVNGRFRAIALKIGAAAGANCATPPRPKAVSAIQRIN